MAAIINGTWTLVITNYTGIARNRCLQPGCARKVQPPVQHGNDRPVRPAHIARTLVTGAIGKTFSRAAPSTPNGVGPGLVIAIDNTLGPDSPYQGRIYAAYVGYDDQIADGTTNPTTNTDIYLAYSDNGGESWVVTARANRQ